jgi:hypothetical protein
MPYIYCIKNNISNKCYIGTTKAKDVNTRWNQHKNLLKKKGGCPILKQGCAPARHILAYPIYNVI